MNAIRRTRSNAKGFTLVEILIVVIILGILAAIVIPQFTGASEDARKSNMQSQLQTLRSQIELYKLEHRDAPPDSANFWTKMTTQTDDNGAAFVAGTSLGKPHGPYMQDKVLNPLTNSNTLAGSASATTGWVYNETTGKINGINKAGVLSDTGD